MVYRRISLANLIDFLKQHEPKLYEKYRKYTSKQFSDMKYDHIKSLNTLISKLALEKKYNHGDMIEFISQDHRNQGMLFWDGLKKTIIPPTYANGEASVPEIFLVGDGFFNPNEWGEELGPVRPCKALLKELKTHFSKQNDPLTVMMNGITYTIVSELNRVDEFTWATTMLISEGTILRLTDLVKAEGKTVNESKLREIISGDVVQMKHTRKLDLEAKLKVALKRLEDAQAEVNHLMKELGGKRGTRRAFSS